MAAWILHGVWLEEKAGARTLCFLRVKWLQPAMKGTSWLHEGCDSDLSVDFLHFSIDDFPFKISSKECFEIVFFSVASTSRFWSCNFWCRCFATQSLQIAMYWLRPGCLVPRLRAWYYCLLSWTSYIVLERLHQGCDSYMLANGKHIVQAL